MYHKALALNIVAGSTEFMCYTAAQLQWCSWRCQQALRHTPAELSPQCAAVPLRSTNERQRHSIEVHKQRAVVFVELTNEKVGASLILGTFDFFSSFQTHTNKAHIIRSEH